MAKKGKRGKGVPEDTRCAVIDSVCPGNGDPAQGRYCPHWTEEPEKNDSGEVRISKGCDIPMMRNWQINAMRAGWVSANFISRLGTEETQKRLAAVLLEAQEQRQQLKLVAEGPDDAVA